MEYKGQVLKLEDTNIAYLGTELEKKIKLEAAKTEIAWKDIGKTPGVLVWRIEKFCVKEWPREEYGNFFSGDSYIVLNTYKKEGQDKLFWNAHMWVGSYTTMDEAGTAAYKIVELDDVLNREVVLFREAQGYESDLFLSYFKTIVIMDGGIETGFKKVPVESYRPRLLHIRKCKNEFKIREVPLGSSSLNSGDCFILDNGLEIFKWIGANSNSFEKFKASSLCDSIKNERNGKPMIMEVVENETDNESFWKVLGGKGAVKPAEIVQDKDVAIFTNRLYRLSDATGELILTQVEFKRISLNSDDVFIADVGTQLIIWIGAKTTKNEKRNSIGFANQYLKDFNRPSCLPFCCISEGKETDLFNEVFS
jgi:gelsolin